MEKGAPCSGCPSDLCQADAHGGISCQHLFFDEFSVLDCQRAEVVVGSDFILSDHSYHLLCFFGMVKRPASRGAPRFLMERNGRFG